MFLCPPKCIEQITDISAVPDIEINRQHTSKLLHILSDDNHLKMLCAIVSRQRCAFSGLSI